MEEKKEEKINPEESPNIITNKSKEEEKINKIESPSQKEKKKLSHKYAFWFRISKEAIKAHQQKQNKNNIEYKSQIKKISEFDTVEDFWAIYQHLKRPDKCNEGIEFHMFKNKIKPIWDDEYNINGGRLTIKLTQGHTDIIWEEILLGLIGDRFPKEISDKINGVLFSAKNGYNIIQIWFREYNENYCNELKQSFRDLIQIPEEVPIYIKQFYRYNNNKKNENKKNDYYYNDNRNQSNNYKRNKNNYYYKK